MADGRYIAKYWKRYNSPINGLIWMKREWSHPIMFPTCPPWRGDAENMMGCDHASCVPVGPLVGELWRFEYFTTWRPSTILNFKNFNIWSCDRHCGPTLLLYTKFQQNWFTRSASDAHNCWMFNALLLGNGRCHGNRNMADTPRTW